MSVEKNTLQEQIIALQPQIVAKAMKDEAFRQHLLQDPKQTMERELGLTIPRWGDYPDLRRDTYFLTSGASHEATGKRTAGIVRRRAQGSSRR